MTSGVGGVRLSGLIECERRLGKLAGRVTSAHKPRAILTLRSVSPSVSGLCL